MRSTVPDFLGIGAMKAGTSSMHMYLGMHPDICVPEVKELNYFRTDAQFRDREDWYASQFRARRPGQLIGEVSPDYTKYPLYPGVPERIKAVAPGVKLIFLAREPVSRMESMYVHQVSLGREARPIDVALVDDPHYRDVSSYAMQLELYLARFDRERLLVIASEQLARDPANAMARIFAHIGVADDDLSDASYTEHNRGTDRRHASSVAGRLRSNEQLARLYQKMPARARHMTRRLVTRPLDTDTRLSAAARASVEELLAEDRHRFLAIAPDVAQWWQTGPQTTLDKVSPA